MAWKLIQNRRIGNNISIIYVKDSRSLELFRDSEWRNNSMNVIVRDKKQKSFESSLGKSIEVKYFDTEKEARDWANKYIGN